MSGVIREWWEVLFLTDEEAAENLEGSRAIFSSRPDALAAAYRAARHNDLKIRVVHVVRRRKTAAREVAAHARQFDVPVRCSACGSFIRCPACAERCAISEGVYDTEGS